MKLDHFNGRLNKLLQQPLNDLKQKLEISIKKTKENEIHYHNALKKLKIITTTKQKLDFLRYLTYLKTFRMEAHMQSFYYTQPLTRQICKQNNLTQSQLNLLTLTEINQLLLGTIKPQSINFSERKHAVVHRINSQIDVHFGKPAYKAFKQKTKASTRDPKNSISGNPASLGKVVGRARIVTQKNINQLQQGEILVASMTNPSFLPAMSKAVAFVTDEGGVLCHAAIVAREMEKPCIVGTGNATQRIKTGDIVLVDANSGDVHLLKKDDQKPNHLK